MKVLPIVGVGLLLTVNAVASADTVVSTEGVFAAGPSVLANGAFSGTWTFDADIRFPPDEEVPGVALLDFYDQNGDPVFTTADFCGVQRIGVRFTSTGIKFGDAHTSMSEENVLWFGLEFAILEGLGLEFLNGSVMYRAEDSLDVSSATAVVIPQTRLAQNFVVTSKEPSIVELNVLTVTGRTGDLQTYRDEDGDGTITTIPTPIQEEKNYYVSVEDEDGNVTPLYCGPGKVKIELPEAESSRELFGLLNRQHEPLLVHYIGDLFDVPLLDDGQTVTFSDGFSRDLPGIQVRSFDGATIDVASLATADLLPLYTGEAVVERLDNGIVLTGSSSPMPILPGDFDLTGSVDGRDFLLWQRNPGIGNLADWEANYGLPLTAGGAAVPEPSSFMIAVAAALLAMPRQRFTLFSPWKGHRCGPKDAIGSGTPTLTLPPTRRRRKSRIENDYFGPPCQQMLH